MMIISSNPILGGFTEDKKGIFPPSNRPDRKGIFPNIPPLSLAPTAAAAGSALALSHGFVAVAFASLTPPSFS